MTEPITYRVNRSIRVAIDTYQDGALFAPTGGVTVHVAKDGADPVPVTMTPVATGQYRGIVTPLDTEAGVWVFEWSFESDTGVKWSDGRSITVHPRNYDPS